MQAMLESKILKIIKRVEQRKNNANNTLNVLLTAYFPVALKLRPAGLYRLDEFNDKVNGLSKEEKKIASELGLALAPWASVNKQIPLEHNWYFILPKGSELKENLNFNFYAYVDTGRILGYPSCCVESAGEDACLGLNSDLRAIEHVKLYKSQGRKIDPLVYYTWGFIPCKPSCSKALETGHKIYSAYLKINRNVAEAYKRICTNWIDIMGEIAEEPTEKLFISADE